MKVFEKKPLIFSIFGIMKLKLWLSIRAILLSGAAALRQNRRLMKMGGEGFIGYIDVLQ